MGTIEDVVGASLLEENGRKIGVSQSHQIENSGQRSRSCVRPTYVVVVVLLPVFVVVVVLLLVVTGTVVVLFHMARMLAIETDRVQFSSNLNEWYNSRCCSCDRNSCSGGGCGCHRNSCTSSTAC